MSDALSIGQPGDPLYDAVATIYVNFYLSELRIIDLCARWIPRRHITREKYYLVHHANDEVRHAELFRKAFENLGGTIDEAAIEKYQVRDMEDRFDRLFRSDDEIEVLIGLNMYAEGVLAMMELRQLGKNAPELFPDFLQIAQDEKTHLAFGAKVLGRILEDEPEQRQRATEIARGYREHLGSYLATTVSDMIDFGVSISALDEDYRQQAIELYEEIMDRINIDVRLVH
ncbi:hypothetical protein AAG614_09290 [Citromicrobium bathyomarinum]|tara:strand:- start:276 stop:962 length:687 start_codon:yes stop_codon:yes gene_type:complete